MPKKKKEDFTFDKIIGEGSYSTVGPPLGRGEGEGREGGRRRGGREGRREGEGREGGRGREGRREGERGKGGRGGGRGRWEGESR